VLQQLEDNQVLAQNIAGEILHYGHFRGCDHMRKCVQAVTLSDIQAVWKKMLSFPPSVTVVGNTQVVLAKSSFDNFFNGVRRKM